MSLAHAPAFDPVTAARRVNLAEAKAQLSSLISSVEAGDTITITKHGRAVAVLSPIPRRRSAREAMDAWLEYQEKNPILNDGLLDIRDRSTYGYRY